MLHKLCQVELLSFHKYGEVQEQLNSCLHQHHRHIYSVNTCKQSEEESQAKRPPIHVLHV